MRASELDTKPAELRIEAGQAGDRYIVRLLGELDCAGAGEVEMALVLAEKTGAHRILLDIDELTFIDSTGLAVLMRAKHRADAAGERLRITRGTGQVADMLRLTALDLSLPFV
ncbi:MAG TPA: STAS domain-containing protein [Solirubrobacterales bacterium]|nr:STAS domain-containing protein [Solirubrobacterales bacterium]